MQQTPWMQHLNYEIKSNLRLWYALATATIKYIFVSFDGILCAKKCSYSYP